MRALVSEYDVALTRTLPEALKLLAANENWRPLAGGTDLMVLFNSGKLPWRRLVSIREIPELCEIEVTRDNVLLGAAVTYSQVRHHSVLQAEFPLLCKAAGWTGAVANQNRGTLGGNIANGSPAADSPPMLLVYDAELELASLSGRHWLPYSAFHSGYKQMQLGPDELITTIRLPRTSRDLVQYARKVGTRKAQAISKVCFAALADRKNGRIHNVRIAAGSVAPIPLRCRQTEQILEACQLSTGMIARAKESISREIQPITDIRSTGRYRTQVAANLLGEFLESVL